MKLLLAFGSGVVVGMLFMFFLWIGLQLATEAENYFYKMKLKKEGRWPLNFD